MLALDAGSGFGRVAENAGAADRVILDVVEAAKELAIRSVHVRLVACEGNDVGDGRGLAEDAIHLLQRPHGGLGEVEVDDRDDGGVTIERLVIHKIYRSSGGTNMTAKIT